MCPRHQRVKCSTKICLQMATAGNRKMTKKVADHLDKLNTDCNMNTGLEAKLSLVVGARVIL